jgi:cysteine synthase A
MPDVGERLCLLGAGYLVADWLARPAPDRTHLVIGADTGHRYVQRVFARHREALDPTTLCPREITTLTELTMPWSAMRWERRPWPRRQDAADR